MERLYVKQTNAIEAFDMEHHKCICLFKKNKSECMNAKKRTNEKIDQVFESSPLLANIEDPNIQDLLLTQKTCKYTAQY